MMVDDDPVQVPVAPAADDVPAVPPPPASPPRPGWRTRLPAVAPWALAALLAALAVGLWLQSAGLRADAEDRRTAIEAAELVALRITTFEGATIDAWLADAQAMATGDYAQELARLFDPAIREGLAVNQVQSVGQITQSFVQEVEGDRAVAFLVLRQEFNSANQPRPISDELRMEVVLRRADDGWLAEEVAVLGPSTIAPVEGEPATQEGGS